MWWRSSVLAQIRAFWVLVKPHTSLSCTTDSGLDGEDLEGERCSPQPWTDHPEDLCSGCMHAVSSRGWAAVAILSAASHQLEEKNQSACEVPSCPFVSWTSQLVSVMGIVVQRCLAVFPLKARSSNLKLSSRSCTGHAPKFSFFTLSLYIVLNV